MILSSGRVLAVYGQTFLVETPLTDITASPLTFPAAGRLDTTPAVGDFVTLRDGVIDGVEPRRSEIRRIAPGSGHEVQVLAANVDVLFIVSGLDGDFNLRRLERYRVLAAAVPAEAVFVLTKADLCPDSEPRRGSVRALAPDCTVIVSGLGDASGVEAMRRLIPPTVTAAMLGSSGAGKSTLINRLLGEDRQRTDKVREHDSRGRHTTTLRQMFRVPGGGWLIDQPGLREIQIAADAEAVDTAFPEIAALQRECRFRDCQHADEPGCAVRERVDPMRLRSFEKLRREAVRAEEEFDHVARTRRKSKIKAIHRAMRGHYRD